MVCKKNSNGATLGFEETLWQAEARIVKQVVSQFGHSIEKRGWYLKVRDGNSMMRRGNQERYSQSVTTYEGKTL